MRRLTALLAASALAAGVLAAPAQAALEYGIERFSVSFSGDQAGAHSDFTTDFKLITGEAGGAAATTAKIEFRLPSGIAGDLAAFPKCTAAELTAAVRFGSLTPESEICPIDSQVGVTKVALADVQGRGSSLNEPVYNMTPGPGEVARFGFVALYLPVLIDVRLDPASHYGLNATAESLSALKQVTSAATILWGDPTSAVHDPQRITPYEVYACNETPCTTPGKEFRHSSLLPTPFMSAPTNCGSSPRPRRSPPATKTRVARSKRACADAPAHRLWAAGLQTQLLAHAHDRPGRDPDGPGSQLTMPQEGLEHPNLLVESHLKRAEVTLPEGITVNPSEAVGIGVCSPADYESETATSAPNVGCPETSKIGNATANSPVLNEAAEGGLYLAKPYDNPFGSLLALYMVLKIPDRGIDRQAPREGRPRPEHGRLVTTFDELPQLPVADVQTALPRRRQGAAGQPADVRRLPVAIQLHPLVGPEATLRSDQRHSRSRAASAAAPARPAARRRSRRASAPAR